MHSILNLALGGGAESRNPGPLYPYKSALNSYLI